MINKNHMVKEVEESKGKIDLLKPFLVIKSTFVLACLTQIKII
jgi:hypothetical protein